MKDKIIRLPDETKVYNRKQFEQLLSGKQKISKDIVLIKDVILALFSTQSDKPIYGRTMLMKQVFLIFEEILKKQNIDFQDPNFVPYYYGPYSFLVTDIIENLEFEGHITITGKKNTNKEAFTITKQGIEKSNKIHSLRSKKIMDEIKEKRVGWDELGTSGILKYVYHYYPKFKDKSKIKERYKEITWGRGRG